MHKNIHIPEKLPFLEAICWQTRDVYQFTPEEMLNRYERGWEYRQIFDNLSEEEINFIRDISKIYHSWLQTCFKLEQHHPF
jgi:hypothetical protein